MENLQNILYIVYGGCVLALSVIGIIGGKNFTKKLNNLFVKEKSEDEATEVEEVKVTEEESKILRLNQVVECLTNYMIEAEKSGMQGAAKKVYVVAMVMSKCFELKLDYSNVKQYLEDKIESLIDFSHEVNGKEKENGSNECETFRL